MWGTGVRDDFTIASQLAKALANEKDVYFDITNFGETGYTNTQELINLVVALQFSTMVSMMFTQPFKILRQVYHKMNLEESANLIS